MSRQNHDEIALRRKLFRLFDKGKSIPQILQLIPRSRSWVYKWLERFQRLGLAACSGEQKTPHTSPHAYPAQVVRTILRLRKRLQNATVGLVGAKALRREVKRHRLVTPVPSLSTIHRFVKAAGLIATAPADGETTFYPWVQTGLALVFQSMDWMLRYLEGGDKVFIFHTLDMKTHALCQTLARDKRTDTVIAHALVVWQQLGLPDFLQIDNDAAFTGLGKNRRIFGRFVRLCLYLGIELIFIPPREAKRNHLVEGVNHLFSQGFWDKNEFSGFSDVERKRGKFLTWYLEYEPPRLLGLSVKEANRGGSRRRLKATEIERLPEELPVTKGRLHFVRKVNEEGEIEILKERWKVSRRLVNRYVWATVNTGTQRLQIYHRRSERGAVKLVKEYDYEVGEKVIALGEGYHRRRRAIRVEKLF